MTRICKDYETIRAYCKENNKHWIPILPDGMCAPTTIATALHIMKAENCSASALVTAAITKHENTAAFKRLPLTYQKDLLRMKQNPIALKEEGLWTTDAGAMVMSLLGIYIEYDIVVLRPAKGKISSTINRCGVSNPKGTIVTVLWDCPAPHFELLVEVTETHPMQ